MSGMVTGGTGFIGARIVRELVQRGEEVVCFDLAPPKASLEPYLDRISVYRGDVTQIPHLLEAVNTYGVHKIIHMAAHLAKRVKAHDPDNPRVPIAVWVCTGCWDGTMKIPPWEKSGRLIDQGIDLDNRNMIKKFHDCPKTGPEPKGKRGNWHQEKLLLPEEIFDSLLDSGGVERGPRMIDIF